MMTLPTMDRAVRWSIMLMGVVLTPALVNASGEMDLRQHAAVTGQSTVAALPMARDEDKHTVDLGQRTYNYDFGTPSSPVREGWTQVTNKATGDIYWTGETRQLRVVAVPAREGINKINTDYVLSRQPIMFNHKIANGTWRITINMGDARRGHDQMGVRAEGKLISDTIDSDRREFVYVSEEGGSESPASFDVEVEDGELNIEWFDNGGRDKYWVMTRMTLLRQK